MLTRLVRRFTIGQLTMQCEQEGCERAAQAFPKLCVPATGWPQDPRRSLQLILGIKLCRIHAAEFPVPDLQLKMQQSGGAMAALADVFAVAHRMSGSALPPDYKRAFIVPCWIDSDEGQSFLRHAQQPAK